MVPTHIFLTRGVGVHREKLASFEETFRNAGQSGTTASLGATNDPLL